MIQKLQHVNVIYDFTRKADFFYIGTEVILVLFSIKVLIISEQGLPSSYGFNCFSYK